MHKLHHFLNQSSKTRNQLLVSLIFALLMLAQSVSAQNVFTVDVPRAYDVTPTYQITSITGQRTNGSLVLRNVLGTQINYTAEVVQGQEWLRILSYSRFIDIEGVDDRDLVEVETICPQNSGNLMGIIRININNPADANPSTQDIAVNLFCGQSQSLSIPVIPGPQGPQGPQGPAGPVGPVGATGVGTQGPAGPVGPVGPVGAPGAQGPIGPVGPVGSQGPQGVSGVSCWDTNRNGAPDANEDRNGDGNYDSLDCVGPQGPSGPVGPVGATGPVGPVGATGATGATGPQGPYGVSCWDRNRNGLPDANEDMNGDGELDALDCVGRDGAPGATGATGATGPVGPVGPIGPVGPVGANGANGATGPVGPVGPIGPVGPVGPIGPVGAVGPIGPVGATGANGATGPVGPVGPQGATGLVEQPYYSFITAFYDFCTQYHAGNDSARVAELERQVQNLQAQLAQYQNCTVTCGAAIQPAQPVAPAPSDGK